MGRITDCICKPVRWAASTAKGNEVTGNIDAPDSAIATNNGSDTFTEETGTAAQIQHTLAIAQSQMLDRFRSLADNIFCLVEAFQLVSCFFGELKSAHLCPPFVLGLHSRARLAP